MGHKWSRCRNGTAVHMWCADRRGSAKCEKCTFRALWLRRQDAPPITTSGITAVPAPVNQRRNAGDDLTITLSAALLMGTAVSSVPVCVDCRIFPTPGVHCIRGSISHHPASLPDTGEIMARSCSGCSGKQRITWVREAGNT